MSDSSPSFHRPIWDRGEAIDADMMRFTIGDDWDHDRRLVPHELRASIAHVEGLGRAGLLEGETVASVVHGLEALAAAHASGEWDLTPADEDVHSAVERLLVERIGDDGKRMHLGRSRNEQVSVAMRLWLRDAVRDSATACTALAEACATVSERHGALPLPGYTHLRRAMPSTVGDWADAHAAAFLLDAADFAGVDARIARSPLGSGSGYGVPLPLDRAGVAEALGFAGPEDPVTAAQHGRGRAELAYLSALEGIALDLGKLAADLWLFSSEEFGFVELAQDLTTGSSLMPQKRNPDLVELLRGQARQVVSDRAALVDVVRDLPSGYHRDFQLVKPPLFRAHDRMTAALPLAARVVATLDWREDDLRAAAADPALAATGRALERARQGVAFRDAYRAEARGDAAP